MEILEDLSDEGKTIVLVTHEQDTASHAKRIIMLKDGLLLTDTVVTNRRSARDGELRK